MIINNSFKSIGWHINKLKDDKAQISIDPNLFRIGQLFVEDDKDLTDINEWLVYREYLLMNDIVSKIMKIIEDNNLDFKFIIALGASGLPIATVLSQALMDKNIFKHVLVLDEKGKKLPNGPPILPPLTEDLRKELDSSDLLLIDSVLKSGNVVSSAYNMLKEYGVNDLYLITIVYNQSFLHEKICADMRDLYYFPLFVWNKEIQKNWNKIEKDLMQNNFSKDGKFITDLKNACKQRYESYKTNSYFLFTDLTERLFKHLLGIFPDLDAIPNLSKYHSDLEDLKNNRDKNNYDLCKYYFKKFVNEIDPENFPVSCFLMSNFFAFTEETYLVQDDHKINLTQFEYSKPKQTKKLNDKELAISLINFIYKLNLGNVDKTIFEEVFQELSEKRYPETLFNFFQTLCFDHSAKASILVERFIAKLLYSLFEDLSYSYRYLKDNSLYHFYNEYTSLFEVTPTKREDWGSFIDGISNFLNLLKSLVDRKHHLRFIIRESYSIPKGSFNIRSFLEGLNVRDFDEWLLYSNPFALREILIHMKKQILLRIGSIDKNIEIPLFSVGMSGSALAFNMTQILGKNGYLNTCTYFLDDKIFFSNKERLNIPKNKKFDKNTPIFIFDSVVKTAFNMEYAKKIIKPYVDKDTPIYYFVIADLKSYERKRAPNEIFKGYNNFHLVPIVQLNSEKKNNISKNTLMTYLTYDIVPIDNPIIECDSCDQKIKNIALIHFKKIEFLLDISYEDVLKDIENLIGVCESCKKIYIIKKDKELFEKSGIYPLNLRAI